jgi:hypothetical protein
VRGAWGVGAGTAAVVLDDGSGPVATGPARAWIDNPVPDVAFGPGTVPVNAHAADPAAAITALELVVDDEVVATDGELARARDLVYAELDWTAVVGVHELVVREVGGGATSAPRIVRIVDGMAPAPERPTEEDGEEVAAGPTTTSTTAPGSTTTTTTTAPGATTTTTSPQQGPPATGSPATTAPPRPTQPPPTQPPLPPAPVIQRADVVAGIGDGRIFAVQCTYTVIVRARVNGAEAVTVSIDGTSFTRPMQRNGLDYSLTIGSGPMWSGEVGSHTVVIVAGNGESLTQATAGTITIGPACPKD